MFRKKNTSKYAASTKHKYTENSIFSIIKKAKAKSNGTTPHSASDSNFQDLSVYQSKQTEERNNKFFT